MKPTDIKFNFEQSLATIDSILHSGSVIPRLGSYSAEKLGGARGAFIDATVMVVVFDVTGAEDGNVEDYARVYDILLTQMYDLVACQPLLLYFDWDGERLRAVFNTTKKPHIDAMVDVAGRIISLTDVINYKIRKETGIKFKVRTAVDFGKVFAVPVGEQGSLMTGKIFSETEHQLSQGTKNVILSNFIYKNMKDEYKSLFSPIGVFATEYEADIVNIGMNNWLKKQIGKL
ncbi:hypothetical protein CIK97_05840 [Prevotella sp. P3-120]|uniref:hypothetical protein n=1 Tax=unclassified Prevotella TaxID=2638335 RepID=UPI000B96B47F|nr:MULTISPECIES: hypothetical protein [unclassified Prevotella]OYP50535.1 hypothetical protein CIK97_05840 [Prevotella sp. P3-120]OYP51119.1 hypothetical protein CIK93_06155 [Prevotella sp. P3-92]